MVYVIGLPDPPPQKTLLDRIIDDRVRRWLQRVGARNLVAYLLFVLVVAGLIFWFTHEIKDASRNNCLQIENLKDGERARLTRNERELKAHRAEYVKRFGITAIRAGERENAERRLELTPVDCDHPTPPPHTTTTR